MEIIDLQENWLSTKTYKISSMKMEPKVALLAGLYKEAVPIYHDRIQVLDKVSIKIAADLPQVELVWDEHVAHDYVHSSWEEFSLRDPDGLNRLSRQQMLRIELDKLTTSIHRFRLKLDH